MHPNHRGWRVAVVGSVFAGLATISVIARLYARFCISRRRGIDDYLIILAWIFAVSTLTTCLLEVAYGLGHQMVKIPPDQVVKLFKVNYAFNIVYISGTTTARTSILFQLLRILTNRVSRTVAWILIIISFTHGIAFILALSFSCQPIAFNWDTSIKNGHCVSQPVIWVVYASINMTVDLCILVLPIHALWRLNLPWKKKILVNFVMALSGSVCIITIVCFNHLAKNVQAMSSGNWDFSYNFVEPSIRAQLELFLSITYACLPCLRPYFKSLFPERSSEDPQADHPPTFGAGRPSKQRRNRSLLGMLYLTDIASRGDSIEASSSDIEGLEIGKEDQEHTIEKV